MQLDLSQLNVLNARNIILWCAEHKVDAEHSADLADMWNASESWRGRKLEPADYILDVPEHYQTFFRMKGWL